MLKKEGQIRIPSGCAISGIIHKKGKPVINGSQIVDSIINKVFPLPDDTMVYPGHGEPTTIGHEKQSNPIAFYR